ncbi:hypothetical protein NKI61_20040 [Mesorhizobium sp. M0514]|uniref:hypothetical protein n=1 Tax=Mesorhizobium sp. M0514 TaxID=2956955 RepID=UPI0033375574
MKLVILLVLSALLSGCSKEKTPGDLGRYAALNEVAFGTLTNKDNYRAGQFMAAWYKACQMARDEMKGSPFLKTIGDDALNMSKANEEFTAAYVEGLHSDLSIAARKPLQRFVVQQWWHSGTGCATILKETPSWALER